LCCLRARYCSDVIYRLKKGSSARGAGPHGGRPPCPQRHSGLPAPLGGGLGSRCSYTSWTVKQQPPRDARSLDFAGPRPSKIDQNAALSHRYVKMRNSTSLNSPVAYSPGMDLQRWVLFPALVLPISQDAGRSTVSPVPDVECQGKKDGRPDSLTRQARLVGDTPCRLRFMNRRHRHLWADLAIGEMAIGGISYLSCARPARGSAQRDAPASGANLWR